MSEPNQVSLCVRCGFAYSSHFVVAASLDTMGMVIRVCPGATFAMVAPDDEQCDKQLEDVLESQVGPRYCRDC